MPVTTDDDSVADDDATADDDSAASEDASDYFGIQTAGCGQPATVSLDWVAPDTDLDVIVYEGTSLEVTLLQAMNYQPDTPPHEEGTISLPADFIVLVHCWNGGPTEWELTLDWSSTPARGDDDSAGDDDDVCGTTVLELAEQEPNGDPAVAELHSIELGPSGLVLRGYLDSCGQIPY